MRYIAFDQAGDTIIEVLIALAVLGAIIGGGFAIATRSLSGVQAAQERTEATKVAEGQIEAVRSVMEKSPSASGEMVTKHYLGPDPTWNAFASMAIPEGYGFCVTDSGEGYEMNGEAAYVSGDPNRVLVKTTEKHDLSKYPTECRLGTDDRYHTYVTISIRRLNYVPDLTKDTLQLTFNAEVFWDGATGKQESLRLNNRFNVTY